MKLNLRVMLAVLSMIGMITLINRQSAWAANPDLVGVVTQVKSNAFGTPPGTQRQKKFLRSSIVTDELLETEKGAGLLVEFLDETTLTIGPSSSMVVDTMVYDASTGVGATTINLTLGLFRYVSGKMHGADVTIITPTSQIGIRGSDAMISVAANGATTVSVFSGVFNISNLDLTASVVITTAQSVSVSAEGMISGVKNGPVKAPTELNIQADNSDPGFGLEKNIGGGAPLLFVEPTIITPVIVTPPPPPPAVYTPPTYSVP